MCAPRESLIWLTGLSETETETRTEFATMHD
jgi:hypothetical protein